MLVVDPPDSDLVHLRNGPSDHSPDLSIWSQVIGADQVPRVSISLR